MANGRIAAAALMLGASLAGCGETKKQKQATADARAATFVPPSVTSRVDYGSQMDRRFRTLDRNGDDYLDNTEWPRADTRLIELDVDGDRKVSAIEWSEGMIRRFDQMDLNRDGTVTSEEQNAWRAARRAGRPAPAPTGAAPGNPATNAADPVI